MVSKVDSFINIKGLLHMMSLIAQGLPFVIKTSVIWWGCQMGQDFLPFQTDMPIQIPN